MQVWMLETPAQEAQIWGLALRQPRAGRPMSLVHWLWLVRRSQSLGAFQPQCWRNLWLQGSSCHASSHRTWGELQKGCLVSFCCSPSPQHREIAHRQMTGDWPVGVGKGCTKQPLNWMIQEKMWFHWTPNCLDPKMPRQQNKPWNSESAV